jgi:hypothetical protein
VWVAVQTPDVTYDVTLPTANISVPTSGGFYNVLASISGTSQDNTTVSTITLSIQDVSAASPNCYAYATNSFDAACPNYFPAQGTVGAWSFAGITWTDGHQYVVTARATDIAGNVQSTFVVGTSSNIFNYDVQSPTSAVSSLTNFSFYRKETLPSITGTAADEAQSGRVASVSYSFKEYSPEQWWNGTTFSGSEQFFPLNSAGAGIWSTAAVVSAMTDGKTYAVRFRATDRAGNVEPLKSMTSFYFDLSTPTTQIQSPADGSYLNALGTISGTAADNFAFGLNPISRVEFEIRADTGGYYQAQTNNFDSAISSFNAAVTTTSWQLWNYSSVPWVSGRKYTIRTRAIDQAGNTQNAFSVAVNSVTLLSNFTRFQTLS